MSWELVNPNQVNSDLIIEKVPAPPEEKYLWYPPRHHPFMLRVAYQNPRGFTQGTIGVIRLLHDGWNGGAAFEFTPPEGPHNWSARQLADRIEILTRDQLGHLEEKWVHMADIGPGFGLGSTQEEIVLERNHDVWYLELLRHQEIEERAGRPIPPLPPDRPLTYENPHYRTEWDIRIRYRSP